MWIMRRLDGNIITEKDIPEFQHIQPQEIQESPAETLAGGLKKIRFLQKNQIKASRPAE